MGGNWSTGGERAALIDRAALKSAPKKFISRHDFTLWGGDKQELADIALFHMAGNLLVVDKVTDGKYLSLFRNDLNVDPYRPFYMSYDANRDGWIVFQSEAKRDEYKSKDS